MAEEEFVDLDITERGTVRIAGYLRCFPFDTWAMEPHRVALRRYAGELGLPEPSIYLDNGLRSRGPLPGLERLMDVVACGIYDVLLIPGPFVFSVHDLEASASVRRITGFGCMVLELPPLHVPRRCGPEPPGLMAPSSACAADDAKARQRLARDRPG
ncbi:hypothetical protein SLUN_30305 [Streptomyces lunaelactis]|uniref:Resolvase/invertase-type recombinase catalytic domain-containing protein n=1 Tax=Streptomyces lunaelactis TaxID=1535768 RepID=A0A2R4T9P9_9ACTN|nr:hypothetical protein [Streptomyces lunaelactis]AVZ75860.1 hypothetical protein SLUN_30305 [Streptomyces lunaelactis]NUK84160.1 hypothetical protein [Streptomyces lunaelactis]